MTRPGGLPLGDEEGGRFEAIHANYWLSGLSGHTIKHELDLRSWPPSTRSTASRPRRAREVASDIPHRRAEAEASIIRCSDAVLASCTVEAEQIAELYGADPTRIEVVAPGVDHASSGRATGPRRAARSAPCRRDVAALRRSHPAAEGRRAGGAHAGRALLGRWQLPPRGRRWAERATGARELRAHDRTAKELGVATAWSWWPPAARAALHLLPGRRCLPRPEPVRVLRARRLGAAACGTPVVASAVGGLTTLVDPGRTGFLVDEPTPSAFAGRVREIVADPIAVEQFSTASVLRARDYTWRGAAARLHEIFDELTPAASSSALSVPAVGLAEDEERAAVVACIDAWAARELAKGESLVAAERQDVTDGSATHRWYLRMRGRRRSSSPSGSRSTSAPSTTRPSSCRRPRRTSPRSWNTCSS